MKKFLVGVVAVLALLCGASTVLILKQRREIETLQRDASAVLAKAAETNAETARTLTRRATEAEATVRELEIRLQEVEHRAEGAQIALNKNAASERTKVQTVEQSNATNSDPSALELEAARLASVHYGAKVQRQYGALFKQLNLSPEKAAALTQLIVDKKQAANDLAAAASRRGDDIASNPDDYADVLAATKTDIDSQIKALLGDNDYAAYKAFDRNTGRANVLAQLQQTLAISGAPLSDSQMAQIEAAMEKSNVAHLNQKVINQSKPFVSPQQLQAMQGQLQDQQAAARLRKMPPPAAVPAPASKPQG